MVRCSKSWAGLALPFKVDEYSVALVNPAYTPHEGDLDQVRVLSKCVADLFSTTVTNVDAEPDGKMFKRQVICNLLDEIAAHDFK